VKFLRKWVFSTLPEAYGVHRDLDLADRVRIHISRVANCLPQRLDTSIIKRSELLTSVLRYRWTTSKVLDVMFTEVLAETPCTWRNHRMPALEAIADTKWGNRLRLVSICRMDMGLITKGPAARWRVDCEDMEKELPIIEYLANLLCKLGYVFLLRYYSIHPKYLAGTWPNWKVSQSDLPEEPCELYRDGRPAYPALAPGA
jgi:hypothetical protein